MSREASTVTVAADRVHDHLRRAILSAEYRPNQRLVEQDLSVQLNVSRTPVREALLRLKQEGLVVQQKGWLVRDRAPEEILELLEARAELEAVAARLAARRIDPETLASLEDLAERMEQPDLPRAQLNEWNDQFHDLITNASGNHVLIEASRGTRINYWKFSMPILFTTADLDHVNEEHRALMAALRDGDGDVAEAVARAHVARTGAIIGRAMGVVPRV